MDLAWFVDKYGSSDESLRRRMTDGLTSSASGLAQLMNTAEIIARRMNQADAGCFVEAILKERLRTNYGDANRSEELSLLEWYPSPEARADLLIQATQGDADRAVERFSEPALADHGLTRAVLEAAARRFKAATNAAGETGGEVPNPE